MIQNDKILHFIAGFSLSMLGVFWLPLVLLGFIFGFGKEFYDLSGRGTPEVDDVIATLIGAVIAMGIVVLV
jgi:VanZ family protein